MQRSNKMKKYFSFLMVALFATVAFTLTSCGDDDDDNGATPSINVPTSSTSSIIGTWLDHGGSEDYIVEDIYWQFRADGSVVECGVWYGQNITPGSDVLYGKWSLSGTTLTIIWEDEKEPINYRVVTLTSDRLIVKHVGSNGSGGDDEDVFEGTKVSNSAISSYL